MEFIYKITNSKQPTTQCMEISHNALREKAREIQCTAACVLRPYIHVCVPRPKRTIVRDMYEIATARQTRKAQFIYTSRNYFQTKVSYIKQITETLAKAFIYDTFIYQFIFILLIF